MNDIVYELHPNITPISIMFYTLECVEFPCLIFIILLCFTQVDSTLRNLTLPFFQKTVFFPTDYHKEAERREEYSES